MPLPSGVHRVTSRGRTYYYFGRGKGSVRLPDPEIDRVAFETKIALLQGREPTPAPGSIADLVALYRGSETSAASVEWRNLKPATQRDYGWHLKYITDRWGEFQAADIQERHVRELRNGVADRPVLANHMLSVLSVLWSFGRERNWELGDPVRGVKRYRVKSDGRAPWPTWAFQIAEDHFRPELRRLYMLGRYTGQRLSDCLAMHLRHVDGDVLRLRQSKTGKPLVIPIHSALRSEIEAVRAEGRLFFVCRADGRPYSSQDFQAMWQREMRKTPQKSIKDGGFSFHGLRKNAVTALALAGCEPTQIQAITGQTLRMVEHYLGTWEQHQLAEQAMAKWEAHTKDT